MSGTYFVVNHVSDPLKTEGIVESYQMVMLDRGQGPELTRLNFVHWPEIPVPFVHEELSENLAFSNLYVSALDAGQDEEEEELPEAPIGEVDEDGLDDEGNEWVWIAEEERWNLVALAPDPEDDEVEEDQPET